MPPSSCTMFFGTTRSTTGCAGKLSRLMSPRWPLNKRQSLTPHIAGSIRRTTQSSASMFVIVSPIGSQIESSCEGHNGTATRTGSNTQTCQSEGRCTEHSCETRDCPQDDCPAQSPGTQSPEIVFQPGLRHPVECAAPALFPGWRFVRVESAPSIQHTGSAAARNAGSAERRPSGPS